MNDIFADLKRGTMGSHSALEATYPFNTMMKPDNFDRQAYTKNLLILASFHHYVSTFIKKSDHKETLSVYLDEASVLKALDSDLGALINRPDTPDFPADLNIEEPEAALAAAYVWMGSSMGAKILYRWLQHSGHAALPTSYYETMIELGKRWSSFTRDGRALADSYTLDSNKCTDYANQLFEGLRLCADALSHTQRHPA